jgi:hypothetical protein
MRIRLGVPDELDDKDRKSALDAALESVTRTVSSLVRNGHAPPAAGQIKAGRVKWHPEPPGDEHFDLPSTIMGRGWGDCDDLAPWHAGSLRAAGIDPGARAIVKKSGPQRWHAVVRRSDGTIEDPSLHAGMGKGVNGDAGVIGGYGAIAPPMSADGRLCLAICPSRDPAHPNIWFARCDVPDQLEPWDWSSTSASNHPKKAVLKAIRGMRQVAGADMAEEDEARLGAFHDLIMGCHPQEVGDALQEIMGDDFDVEGCMSDAEHSVGWFGSNILKAAISPVTSAVNFVKHPSLKNLTRIATDPITSHIRAAQPFAKVANMAMPFAKFVPGLGPLAAAGVDFVAHGVPKNFGDFAKQAMHAGMSAIPIPGLPPQLAQMLPGMASAIPGMASAFGGGGGGGGAPQMPGMPPQMQAAFAQFLAQQGSAPRFSYEAGRTVRPWGASGPAVMKF